MNKVKRTLLRVLFLALLFLGYSFPIEVHAETKTADLITTEKEEDLAVMFSYDKEIVDIVFIAPDGTKYTENDSNVETSSGELWKTYRIRNAIIGTWKVEYDLKSNTEIKYSIIEDSVGLWIQYINIVEQSTNKVILSFMAENSQDDVYYNYTISAIDTNTNDGYELMNGTAKSGEDQMIDVSLLNLTSGNYIIQLQVYYDNGSVELFDTLYTDAFTHVNPNTPEKMEDIKVKIDLSNLVCSLDWQAVSSWKHEEYKIQVIADGENIFDSVVDSKTTQLDVIYPKTSSGIEVYIYYKTNDIWSEPLVRRIELGDEYLSVDDIEITNQGQVTLDYFVKDETQLYVSVNENSGEYIISEGGSIAFDLDEGINHVYAYFENSEHVIYLIDKDIYYDAYPPTITLYDEINGKTVDCETLDIMGAIDGGETLFVNGKEYVIDANGAFRVAVNLQQGENSITLEAVDTNGNSSMMNVMIYRGLTTENKRNDFIVFLVSLVGGVLFAIVTIFISKKKVNKQEGKKKNTKLLYAFWVIIDVACGGTWFFLHKYVNTLAFLDLAEKSVNEALLIIVLYKIFLVMVIFITLVLVVMLVINKALRKKERGQSKERNRNEEQKEMIEEEFKFCSQCGKKLEKTARFCSECGNIQDDFDA